MSEDIIILSKLLEHLKKGEVSQFHIARKEYIDRYYIPIINESVDKSLVNLDQLNAVINTPSFKTELIKIFAAELTQPKNIELRKQVREALALNGSEDETLTLQQTMERLHISSRSTMLNYDRKGTLTFSKPEGRVTYKKSEVDKFLNSRKKMRRP